MKKPIILENRWAGHVVSEEDMALFLRAVVRREKALKKKCRAIVDAALPDYANLPIGAR